MLGGDSRTLLLKLEQRPRIPQYYPVVPRQRERGGRKLTCRDDEGVAGPIMRLRCNNLLDCMGPNSFLPSLSLYDPPLAVWCYSHDIGSIVTRSARNLNAPSLSLEDSGTRSFERIPIHTL